MTVLSRRVLKATTALLGEVAGTPAGAKYERRIAELLWQIDSALKPKRSVRAARVVRKAKQKTRKEEMAELRAKVFERAGSTCESCAVWGALADLDHFHGGKNRRALESVEGTWLLCRRCHHNKTNNIPTAEFWLRAFLVHSKYYDYDAEPQKLAAARLESLRLQGRAGGWA